MTEWEGMTGGIDARLLDEGYGRGESGTEEKIRYACHQLWYFTKKGWKLRFGQKECEPEPGKLYLIPAGTACQLERAFERKQEDSGRKEPEGKEGLWRCCFRLSFPGERELCCFREIMCCRPDGDRMEEISAKMCKARVNTAGGWLLRQAAFLELLALFLEAAENSEHLDFPKYTEASEDGGRSWEEGRLDEFGRRVVSYVDSHLSEHITVKDLADAVHLQPGYFIQRFKKSFHTTPISYVNKMRLEHTARQMEGRPDERLEEIARVAGFWDYRYFSRLFKREYGMPPSVYRANRLGGGEQQRQK